MGFEPMQYWCDALPTELQYEVSLEADQVWVQYLYPLYEEMTWSCVYDHTMNWCVYDKDHTSALWIKNTNLWKWFSQLWSHLSSYMYTFTCIIYPQCTHMTFIIYTTVYCICCLQKSNSRYKCLPISKQTTNEQTLQMKSYVNVRVCTVQYFSLCLDINQ